MPENKTLPIALITSSNGKAAQFKRYAPVGLDIFTTPNLFCEPSIKLEVERRIPITNGYEYVAAISRGKFTEQRQKLLEQEGEEKDYAFLVSDAVAMVEQDGVKVAVNRDIPDIEKQAYLESINKKGALTFIGAVTFGRKNGKSAMTILSYVEIPLSKPITRFPDVSSISDVSAIKDPNRPYSVGYIKPNVISGSLVYERKLTAQTHAYDEEALKSGNENARPYISGITRDVIELAEKTAIFDNKVAPMMQASVSQHPFNTLSLYAGFRESGFGTFLEYYKDLIAHPDEHFAKNGGNCTLFVLDLHRKLKQIGIDSSVAVFSTVIPPHEMGHGALIVNDNGQDFFLDPGLSFVWSIPISKKIPLFPSPIEEGKMVMLDVGYIDRNHPDIIILRGDTKYVLRGKKRTDIESFRKQMPQVLSELHDIRKKIKIDYHNQDGEKEASVVVDRGRGTVDMQFGDTTLLNLSVNQVIIDPVLQKDLTDGFGQYGIPFNSILDQLKIYQS